MPHCNIVIISVFSQATRMRTSDRCDEWMHRSHLTKFMYSDIQIKWRGYEILVPSLHCEISLKTYLYCMIISDIITVGASTEHDVPQFGVRSCGTYAQCRVSCNTAQRAAHDAQGRVSCNTAQRAAHRPLAVTTSFMNFTKLPVNSSALYDSLIKYYRKKHLIIENLNYMQII